MSSLASPTTTSQPMDDVLAAVQRDTEQDDELMEKFSSSLKSAMLFNPWKLRQALVNGESELLDTLGPILFDMGDALARLAARGFFITVSMCVTAWCKAHSEEDPTCAHQVNQQQVNQQQGQVQTQVQEPGQGEKRRKREADPRLRDIKPKLEAAAIESLPKHLLDSAQVLQTRAAEVGKKVSAYEMRAWMDSLRCYLVSNGVFGKEFSMGCLSKENPPSSLHHHHHHHHCSSYYPIPTNYITYCLIHTNYITYYVIPNKYIT